MVNRSQYRSGSDFKQETIEYQGKKGCCFIQCINFLTGEDYKQQNLDFIRNEDRRRNRMTMARNSTIFEKIRF